MKPYFQVDVFGTEPLMGNPLAVIAAADDLSEQDMQRIARWTNLSETTFLLEPTTKDADYRVRILHPPASFPSPATPHSAPRMLSSNSAANPKQRALLFRNVPLV